MIFLALLFAIALFTCSRRVEGFQGPLYLAKLKRTAPASPLCPTTISGRYLHVNAHDGSFSSIETNESSEGVVEQTMSKKKISSKTADITSDDGGQTETKKKRAPRSPKLSANGTETEEPKKKRASRVPKLKDSNSTSEAETNKKKGKKKEAPLTPRQASGYNFTNEDDLFPLVEEPKWFKLLAMPRYEIKLVQFIKQKIIKKKDHPLHGVIVDAHVMCVARQPMPAGVIYIKSIMNSTIGEYIVESMEKIIGYEKNIHGFVTPLGPSLLARVEKDIATSTLSPDTDPASLATRSSSDLKPSAPPRLSTTAKKGDKGMLFPPVPKTSPDDLVDTITSSSGSAMIGKLPTGGSAQEALAALKTIMGNMGRLKKLRREGIPDNELIEAAFSGNLDAVEEDDYGMRGRSRGATRGGASGYDMGMRSESVRRPSSPQDLWGFSNPEAYPVNPRRSVGDRTESNSGGRSRWSTPSASTPDMDTRSVGGFAGDEPRAGAKAWGKTDDRANEQRTRWGQGDSRLDDLAASKSPEKRSYSSPAGRQVAWSREASGDGVGFTLDQVLEDTGRSSSGAIGVSGVRSTGRDDLGDLYDMLEGEEVDTETTRRVKEQSGQGARKDTKVSERTSKDRTSGKTSSSKGGIDDIARDASSFASFDDFLAAISGGSPSKKK